MSAARTFVTVSPPRLSRSDSGEPGSVNLAKVVDNADQPT